MNAAIHHAMHRAPESAHASAYESLVDRLADDLEEPRYGYRDASDIRALTATEVTIVKDAKPVDFNDAFVRDLDTSDWTLDRPLMLAARVQIEMEEAARRVLILDVQDEIARRAEFDQWENVR